MNAELPKPISQEEELRRQIAALQTKLAQVQSQATLPPESSVNTDRGSEVHGSVRVANGHFIGRDFVQVIEKQFVQREDTERAESALASYLYALATNLAGLQLGDIDASPDQTRQTRLELADIYVPLDTTFQLPKGDRLEDAVQIRKPGERLPVTEESGSTQVNVRAVSAIEVLATHKRLTLLGAPGSGKSTFGNFVLLALAQALLGQVNLHEQLSEAWTAGPLLPLRVVLRRFAERHAGIQKQKELDAGDLWNFIGEDLQASGWGKADDAINVVQRLARTHGALVLFDGLDECGEGLRRQRVLNAVEQFMDSAGRHSRFLLTARPYAFPRGVSPSQGIYRLADLDAPKIETFIKAWYAALVRRGWQEPAIAQRKCDDLLAAYARPDLLPLAANPLLLTLMATLHSNRGRLPDDRADLYNDTVDLLLQRWNRDVGADRALLEALAIPTLTLAHLRSVLERVAYEAHKGNVGAEGAAEIGEDHLVRAFTPLLQGSKDKATQVVEFIERRAGLLLGLGKRNSKENSERLFGFPHRTFQEFLAACHLQARSDFASKCRRLSEQNAGHWRLVLVLAARLAKAERGASAADELIGGQDVQTALRAGQRPTLSNWQHVLTASLQLQEIGASALAVGHVTRATLARVQDWLRAGLTWHPSENGAPAPERAALGDMFATLGDPRFAPGRLYLPADDMLGFVQVEADPLFCIGTRRADRQRVEFTIGLRIKDHEINDNLTPTPTFYIARYPVTVAQFRAYVEATGRQPEDDKTLLDPANYPVRWLSWNEATAYCDWLHERLLRDSALANTAVHHLVCREGWRASLPSELEWEKAARGGLVGHVYSWGDEPDPERANVDSSGIGSTCAVGCFPPNGFGLHDMLGNVCQWTRSSWFAVDGTPNDYSRNTANPQGKSLDAVPHSNRVVRGGSGPLTHINARCGFRAPHGDNFRDDSLGFRVALRPSPDSGQNATAHR